MTTGRKLAVASVLVAGAIVFLTYLGAAESWQYYLTVDECLKDASSYGGTCLRVNGRVAVGSLKVAPDRRQADFVLQGEIGTLTVTCRCPIPDNLAENMDVVVEGRIENKTEFRAVKVLTLRRQISIAKLHPFCIHRAN